MSNVLLTPQLIAQQALATLYESLVMVPLVYTDISSEFTTQKIGNTINIRKPAVFTANKFVQGGGIILQDAVEGNVPVTLNQLADTSFSVSSQELTTSIVNFDEQFLTPACMALAEQIDRDILGLRSGITQTVGVAGGLNVAAYTAPEVLIDAGRVLDLAKVPQDGRSFVSGPITKANFLNSPTIKYVMNSGDNEALRRASIGENLFNFDAYQTQNVKAPASTPAPGSGLPTTEVGVAFHETAFAFASAPLELAPGSFASVQTYNGISIRVAYQYDINQKKTIVSLDTLYGVTVLDANRACLVQGALA